MAITLVQTGINFELELPDGLVTMPSPVTAGNTLIGLVTLNPPFTVEIGTNYSDSLSNTWVTQSVTAPTGFYNYGLGYALSIAHGGTVTIDDNVTGGVGSFFTDITHACTEWAGGIDTFIGATSANNGNTGGSSRISITFDGITFTTADSYVDWFANYSRFSVAADPSNYLDVVSIASNTAIFNETPSGWTPLFLPDGGNEAFGAWFYRISTPIQPQTITFNPATPVTYSSVGQQITLSATGGGSGNPVTFSIDPSSTGTGTLLGDVLTVSSVGAFVINANQAGNGEYTPAPQVQRTIEVVLQSQTITDFTVTTPVVFFGVPIPITLTALGGGSGNPVVFSIDPSSTAMGTIVGNTLTITYIGQLVIDANQAGSATFSPATQVQRTIVVNPPQPMVIETNQPYLNRIQWILGSDYAGPFVQDGPLGLLDPRRDLEIYVDGVLTPVLSYTFDTANNRYLMYTERPFNLQGVIQVVHHMPSPPFKFVSSSTPRGFGNVFGDIFGS